MSNGSCLGGAILFPGTAAWIADSYNGNDLTPLEQVQFAIGGSGPPGGGWGDYLSTRPHAQFGSTWVGTGLSIVGGAPVAANTRSQYVWFGRQEDEPVPNNSIYVDASNSNTQRGTQKDPYNSVNAGVFASSAGDTVIVTAGTYPEHLTISSEITLVAARGSVVIGE